MAGSAEDRLGSMRLADALCARLCHDLSSPLGTLMGALEMVAEDPSAAEDAIPIASETAAAMVARLRLLRAAWAGDCGPLTVAQIAELASGLPTRIRVDLAALHDGPFDGPMSRAVLNLLLLGTEALPRGGVLALATTARGDIVATVEGKGSAWPPGLAEALADPGAAPLDNPRAVQPPVAAMLAHAAGARLSLMPTTLAPDTAAPLLLAAG